MKVNKLALALIALIGVMGASVIARGGGRGGRGGNRGGRGWNRGGGRWHGRGYRRGYWGRPYGYGYPAVGFGISSAPSTTVCAYASPDSSYYRYKRQYQDPIKDQSGYQAWLKDNYPDWQNRWQQFQSYLDYRSCKKSGSNVGFSFGVGTGYGYGPYRGW